MCEAGTRSPLYPAAFAPSTGETDIRHLRGAKLVLMVQCDFDGTITDGIVSELIREDFGPPELRAMEEEYVAGKLSVEESNIRQFALVCAGSEEIEDLVLGGVVVRYAFDEFVDYCRGEGIRFAVVSSGLDLYINPILGQMGLDDLEVHSAVTDVSPNGIRVEYSDPAGCLISRGFKLSYLRHFKEQGHTVVYLGDGLSDIEPAQEADFVIARDSLEAYFRENDLPHFSFENFQDVAAHVEQIRGELAPPQ